uniref:U8 snoRNA-decapping enzyme n=1 Tax=Strigamia maritima TaxID=126957 RepID=T1JIE0_STRMM
MQMRFDGQIGFPGGLVNPGEKPVDAVNREMREEIDLDLSKHRATDESHVMSHVDHKTKLVTHFFAIEVNLDEFLVIEKRCLDAEDYGEESLGVLRACLYTMADKIRGFPSFLKQNFVGCCKEQLCQGLRTCNIMTEEEIRTGLSRSNDIKK